MKNLKFYLINKKGFGYALTIVVTLFLLFISISVISSLSLLYYSIKMQQLDNQMRYTAISGIEYVIGKLNRNNSDTPINIILENVDFPHQNSIFKLSVTTINSGGGPSPQNGYITVESKCSVKKVNNKTRELKITAYLYCYKNIYGEWQWLPYYIKETPTAEY